MTPLKIHNCGSYALMEYLTCWKCVIFHAFTASCCYLGYKKKTAKERPSRMCIFCRKLIPNPLSRHITRCHNEVPEVKEAMKLPKKQKHQRFHSFKLQDILQFNKSQATLDNPCYQNQRERWSHKTDNAISCSGCSTFISQKENKKNISLDTARVVAR